MRQRYRLERISGLPRWRAWGWSPGADRLSVSIRPGSAPRGAQSERLGLPGGWALPLAGLRAVTGAVCFCSVVPPPGHACHIFDRESWRSDLPLHANVVQLAVEALRQGDQLI